MTFSSAGTGVAAAGTGVVGADGAVGGTVMGTTG